MKRAHWRPSRLLTLPQALKAMERGGFDMRFRVLASGKTWGLILAHGKKEHFDGSVRGGDDV